MLHSKKLCLSLLFIALAYQPLVFSEFDIFDELIENNDFLESPADPTARQVNPQDVAAPLIIVGIQNLLEKPLFCHTNSLNTRNLVDFSIFLPQKVGTYCYDSTFGAQLFWNKTSRMNFTGSSDSLCSYLSIFGDNALELIQDSVDEIKEFFPDFAIEPINILILFQNMTVEERKLGFMFHFEQQIKRFNFMAIAPIYYVERNFFLTPQEQDAIESELGVLETESQMAFAERHLISDKLGLGDTRLTFDVDLTSNPECPINCLGMRIGLLATLPTASAFKKGLKGTYFRKDVPRPTFSFASLFDASNIEATTAVMQQFLFQALDHLSANLLDPQLGNGGHLGIGGLMRSVTPLRVFIKRPWAHDIYFKSYLSLEYLCAAKEQRFYVEPTPMPEFTALGLNRPTAVILENIATDPLYAQAVVDFLDVQFVDYLFPFVFDTKVNPGVVFRWTSRIYYEGMLWGFYIGSDLWLQGKEKLHHIKKGTVPPAVDLGKATRPVAYQSKVLGSVFYTKKTPCHDWIFGLSFDNTVMNSGIGNDFTISLNIEANF